MREKYESLALTQLKELAKVRGIKGVSAMKKNDVVEAMLALDEKEKTEKEKQDKAEKPAIDEQSVKAEKTHRAESTEKISAYEAGSFPSDLDSGQEANGILEVMPDGYGFIRCENYMPGDHDVYVAPSQIRRFGLKTGDILIGNKRTKTQQEKFSALLYIKSVNGFTLEETLKRSNFEEMTPISRMKELSLRFPVAAWQCVSWIL